MRVYCFCVCCVLWLWSVGLVWGQEKEGVFTVEMETKECERLIPRLFSRSADYQEGVDVYGKAVVPADGGVNGVEGKGWLGKKISFDVHVDLARYLPEYGEGLGRVGLVSGGVGVEEEEGVGRKEEEGIEVRKVLSEEEEMKKGELERDIGALTAYEGELLWTRRVLLGESGALGEELEGLQKERKRINGRLADLESLLMREKERIEGATGGKEEKDEALLLLRRESLREAEEKVYYGEEYLRWQRLLSANEDAQERVKQGMLIRTKAEEEGEEGALVVNERALVKTRKRLAVLRGEYRELTGRESEVREVGKVRQGVKEERVLPYGLKGWGGVARVEYDMGKGLLTINGYSLGLEEMKELVGKCQELSRRMEKGF